MAISIPRCNRFFNLLIREFCIFSDFFRAFCIIVFLLLIFSGKALAQLPPERALSDSEAERLIKDKPPEERAPESPEAEVEEEKPVEASPKAEVSVRLLVRKIIVEGSTVFTQEALHKITCPYENKEVTLQELNAVADEITQMYLDAGYVTSFAYIPPQEIKEGIVIIKVFEGKIGKINIQGNRYFKSFLITPRFDHLKGKILNQNELRLVLLRLNKNPDLAVKVTLMSGEEPQTTDILLAVKDKFPHHAGYIFNNRGGRLTRRLRHLLSYTSNNFLGLGDSLSLQLPWVEGGSVKGESASYVIPLNDGATKLGFNTGYTRVKIGKDFEELMIRSTSKSYSAYVQHSLYETTKLSTEGKIGIEAVDSITKSLGGKIAASRLRVLNLGVMLNEQDFRGRTNISSDVDIGFRNFLGSSEKDDPLLSPRSSTSEFKLLRLGITRFQAIPHSSYLLLFFQGQITPDKLTSQKRLSLGGAYSVRGYPEGAVTGDYGFNSTLELLTPCYIIPESIKLKNIKLKDMFQLAFFTDGGAAFNRGSDDRSFLAGSGVGLRFRADSYSAGRIDFAWALGEKTDEAETGDFRIHFSLAFNY